MPPHEGPPRTASQPPPAPAAPAPRLRSSRPQPVGDPPPPVTRRTTCRRDAGRTRGTSRTWHTLSPPGSPPPPNAKVHLRGGPAWPSTHGKPSCPPRQVQRFVRRISIDRYGSKRSASPLISPRYLMTTTITDKCLGLGFTPRQHDDHRAGICSEAQGCRLHTHAIISFVLIVAQD